MERNFAIVFTPSTRTNLLTVEGRKQRRSFHPPSGHGSVFAGTQARLRSQKGRGDTGRQAKRLLITLPYSLFLSLAAGWKPGVRRFL